MTSVKRRILRPFFSATLAVFALVLAGEAYAASDVALFIPLNRSTMVTLSSPASEVVVANPDIADVHVHNATHVTIVAKGLGTTTVRILNKEHSTLRELNVQVGYDLPAIRKSLKNFLPDEEIGVEMVNDAVALTGSVSSAAVADKALKITKEFVRGTTQQEGDAAPDAAGGGTGAAKEQAAPAAKGKQSGTNILNFLQVTSGQQVMLRVRVGEIQRSALKELGIDLNAVANGAGSSGAFLGTGGGIASLVSAAGSPAVSPGVFLLPGGQTPVNTQGVLGLRWQPSGPNGNTYAGLLKALEQDGLFKVLAEPNLVAVSGEEAEFLSGGEIPIPVVQGGGTAGGSSVSIQYKPFGVAVKFTPQVLSESRIRMMVQPEVSEVSSDNAVQISGFNVPSIDTRRAKTTVELAPGESFMIAGLITDQTRANINQLPGAKELPILGALFRSTEFQRNETELVIAVTPYIVNPMKSSDVKLPTDDFRPASQMEMFFYGALGTLSGKPSNAPKTQSLEGPTGFMVD